MSYFLMCEDGKLFPISEEKTCFVLFSNVGDLEDGIKMQVFGVYESYIKMKKDLDLIKVTDKHAFYVESDIK